MVAEVVQKPDAVRSSDTRERILSAAEVLFAEHGVFAVSNRKVGETAGQRNISAVGYHFGTKADLVIAIVGRHTDSIERYRADLLEQNEGSSDVRDWIECIVVPVVEHLASTGPVTSYARFSAQVMTDPVLRELVQHGALASPLLQKVLRGLGGCVSQFPAPVRRARADMTSHLIVHMCAEHERKMADGDERTSWSQFGTDLVDALVGLWTAPISGVAAHLPRK